MIPREADFTTKQESSATDNAKNISNASSSSTTSWSRLKDPRIVRVSRAFGGKDRHSKVCTVRGLRDRRVRLSVPTAIQLYDLQDRLGLNQPSKVVDWLLNAAKHEIDELPPLQIPQGSFIGQSLHPMLTSQSDKQGLKISGSFNWNDQLKHPRSSTTFGAKSKDVSGETSDRNDHSWATSEEERQFNMENQGNYVSSDNFLSRQNPSSLPSLLNSATAPYNSFVRWDPSNLSLSHPPISLGLTAQHEDLHNFSLVQSMSVPPGSHQVLVYQPVMTTQPYFPSQIAPTNPGFDPKQPSFLSSDLTNSSLTSPVDHSTTQPLRPFHFGMTADLLPSQNKAVNEQNKHDKLHSS